MGERIAPEDPSTGTCLVKLAGTKARVTYDDLLDVDRLVTRGSVDGATPDPYDVFVAPQELVLRGDTRTRGPLPTWKILNMPYKSSLVGLA